MDNLSSKFKPVSYGTVAEDLPLSGDGTLLVVLSEAMPSMQGPLLSNTQTVEASGVDSSGKQYTTSTTTDTVVKASWLRWGSQRITPPNMRKGMRVQVYQFADQDAYYWEDIGLDPQLKRLESVVYGFNNNANGTDASSQTPENMHTFEVSTHTKQITLRTCKAQGEPFGYVLQLNLGSGAFNLLDDAGNGITLDSTESVLKVFNAFGSFLQIEKNNYSLEVADTATIKADQLTITANTVNVQANETTVDCPSSTFTGLVSVGTLTTGASGESGNSQIPGNLNIDGSLSVGGGITCAGLTSSLPISAPNIN